LSAHPSLKFSLSSGNYYAFEFVALMQTPVQTNGIRVGLNFPAATVVSAQGRVPISADGAGQEMQGWITSSGDSVVGASMATVNVPVICTVKGVIVPSANGTLNFGYGGELGTTAGIVCRQGSYGILRKLN
jgi:hypothetical protein